MRRLMLLRHAKSERPPGLADQARPLTGRGDAAARLMGAYMEHHGLVPDRVLCSPARRTRETLAAAAAQWRGEVSATFEERLYAAPPEGILSIIGAQPSEVKNLLVIGHNPGLHEAAQLLIATGDVALRERLREKFPTAALAVIDFAAEDWSLIHDRSGRLDRFIAPRPLAEATS
ncbi:MAG: SixA phosphatase family protein [Alphaproteobacteria bacterium]